LHCTFQTGLCFNYQIVQDPDDENRVVIAKDRTAKKQLQQTLASNLSTVRQLSQS
jgi:hypothetical protein